MGSQFLRRARFLAQRFVSSTRLRLVVNRLKKSMGKMEWHRNPDYWDNTLKGSLSYFMAGRGVQFRNTLLPCMLRDFAGVQLKSVLDVGCAQGTLGEALTRELGIESYVGVDISQFVIEKARRSFSVSLVIQRVVIRWTR